MASYFPFRTDSRAPSGNDSPAIRIIKTRILLTRLLPDELVDPILDFAEMTFEQKTERKEPKGLLFHDSSGRIWNIQDRQEREAMWVYLRSQPLLGPVDRALVKNDLPEDLLDGSTERESLEATGIGLPPVPVAEIMSEHEEDERQQRNPWKVKEIQLATISRDQGWSDAREFHGSSTCLSPSHMFSVHLEISHVSDFLFPPPRRDV